MRRHLKTAAVWAVIACTAAGPVHADKPPVIDMHLHALPYTMYGPPPLAFCTPLQGMPHWNQTGPYGETMGKWQREPGGDEPVWSAESDEELLERTLASMERHNVYGVVSGPPKLVEAWVEADPDRFWPGLMFQVRPESPSPERIVAMHEDGKLDVFGEITTQYQGILPTDEALEPYWAALEEHDIPAGIHIGPGPPGIVYLGASNMRARMNSALTLEEVLVKHPKLRVYIMHAGYPMLDDLIAVMYLYPQVYVEVGIIVYSLSKPEFYRYVKGIVDAGFADRIMFGSDQMIWPETIDYSVRVIEDAPFLSEQQKRDILFNNAARFLRLTDEQIAAMGGG